MVSPLLTDHCSDPFIMDDCCVLMILATERNTKMITNKDNDQWVLYSELWEISSLYVPQSKAGKYDYL